jgi:acyl-CoA thioester hydrolase
MAKHSSTTASPEFRMRSVAPASDVDELGHISNIAYVRWIQEVAVAHSTAVGFTTQDYLARGAIFVVRKHEVEYLSSALAGDVVELITHLASFRGAQSQRHTRIVRVADGVDLVHAITKWVFVRTDNGRPTRIASDLQQAFYRPLVTETNAEADPN